MTLIQGVLSPPVAAAYAFDEVALVFALIWIDCDRRVRHWTRSVGHRGAGERWGAAGKRRSDGGDGGEARSSGRLSFVFPLHPVGTGGKIHSPCLGCALAPAS